MQTKFTRREFLASTLTFAVVSTFDPSVLLRRHHHCHWDGDLRISGLRLNKHKLKRYLGVGNVPPRGAQTYGAWAGWHGKGSYNFVAAGYVTPYLDNVQQLNNWNYVLFRKERAAVNNNNELQPVDRKIRKAVDRLVRRRKN